MHVLSVHRLPKRTNPSQSLHLGADSLRRTHGTETSGCEGVAHTPEREEEEERLRMKEEPTGHRAERAGVACGAPPPPAALHPGPPGGLRDGQVKARAGGARG